jgi:hypothetical protein
VQTLQSADSRNLKVLRVLRSGVWTPGPPSESSQTDSPAQPPSPSGMSLDGEGKGEGTGLGGRHDRRREQQHRSESSDISAAWGAVSVEPQKEVMVVPPGCTVLVPSQHAADDFLGESLSHMLSYLKSPKDMDKVLGALCEGTSKLLCLRLCEVTASHCSHCSLGQAVLSSCNVHDVIESRSLHSLRGIAPGHRRDSL